jgi:hypothetical protein
MKKGKNIFKTAMGQKYGKIKKFIGGFKTMVKSGEIYSTDTFNVENGYLQDQESRPRNI